MTKKSGRKNLKQGKPCLLYFFSKKGAQRNPLPLSTFAFNSKAHHFVRIFDQFPGTLIGGHLSLGFAQIVAENRSQFL